jgi:hypothetical protein
MEKPPVRAGIFFPSPMMAFYIPPCRKCLPAWRNVKYQHERRTICSLANRGLFHSQNCNFPEESFIICILYSAIQDNHCLGDHYVSSIPTCAQNKIFSYRVSLRNIPEPPEKLGVGLFIYPGLTGEIFSLPLTLTPTPSGEIPRMVLLQCRNRIFIPLALRL